MVRLFLIRHCQSTWNDDGRIQGQQDPPLSVAGREQAQALGRRLRGEPLAAVYCSDLSRGYQTGKAIAAPHGQTPVQDTDLRERRYGVWEGQPLTGLMADTAAWERHQHDPAWAPKGAENGPELYRRTQAALERIVRRHEGDTVAVVMHGGGMRMYFCCLFGLSLEHYWQVTVSHGSISVIDWQAVLPTLIQWNDTHHLTVAPGASTIY